MVNCIDCKKREGIVKYSDEPIFALTHGFGISLICRECYIKRISKTIANMKINLEAQKRLLKKENRVNDGKTNKAKKIESF